MTRIISLLNKKGGVGKTTLTFNLAHGLALKGYKVLAIDNAGQGHLTRAFLPKATKPLAFTHALYDGEIQNPQNVADKVWLFAGGDELDESQHIEDGPEQFAAIMTKLQARDLFDYILIDSDPQLTNLTLASMRAASHLLVPVQPAEFGIDGLKKMFATLRSLKSTGSSEAVFLGFVMSMVKPTVLHRHKINALRKQFPQYYLESHIKMRTALEESPIMNKSIFEYEPNGKAAHEMNALVTEICNKVEG